MKRLPEGELDGSLFFISKGLVIAQTEELLLAAEMSHWARMAALKSLQCSPSILLPLFSVALRIFDSAPFLWAWEEGMIQGLY